MVKLEWFTPFTPSGKLIPEYFIQAWDTATDTGDNHDYSVCLTFGIIDNKAYLANVFRGKLLYPDLLKKAIELANQYKPKVILVEKANIGPALIKQLQQLTKFQVLSDSPTTSKEDRLASVSHLIEQGCIHLAKPWDCWPPIEQAYIDELTGFPNTKHDDQVDATSLFLKWFLMWGPGNLLPKPKCYIICDDGSMKIVQ